MKYLKCDFGDTKIDAERNWIFPGIFYVAVQNFTLNVLILY